MRAKRLSDVKEANTNLLYECIRAQKQLSVSDLERITSLSRPTVVGILREMEAKGMVLQAGRGASSGGRAPMLYSINAQAFFAVGIDFEFPAIRMAISDLEGRPVHASIRRYPQDADKDRVIRLLLAQLEELLAAADIPREKYLGICMGIPGRLDSKNGISVLIERIHGWEDVPIAAMLGERFGMPVYLKNDVNLMAWAEKKLRTSQDGSGDMLYIAIRAGLGMAVVIGGQILEGEGGNAGRIGHMSVDSGGPTCLCGNQGCLRLYASEIGMCRMYQERTGETLAGIAELLAKAREGSREAQEVLATAGHYLGIGILNAVNIFDLSQVVVATRFDPEHLLRHAFATVICRDNYAEKRPIHIAGGQLEENQYALGGCWMMIDIARGQSPLEPTPPTA